VVEEVRSLGKGVLLVIGVHLTASVVHAVAGLDDAANRTIVRVTRETLRVEGTGLVEATLVAARSELLEEGSRDATRSSTALVRGVSG
jgi:hypothetical protein